MKRKVYLKRAAGAVLAMTMAFSQLGAAGTETIKAATGNAEAKDLSWQATELVVNGDFETGDESGWTVNMPKADADSVGHKVKINQWSANNKTNYFNVWNNHSQPEEFSLSQEIALTDGTYKLGLQTDGAEAASGIKISIAGKSLDWTTAGWDVWNNIETEEFSVSGADKVTLDISGNLAAGYWGDLDDIVLYRLSDTQSKPVDDEVTVKKVEGISDDFITGADISSYLSVINSGAKFFDKDGNVLTQQGFFDLLAAGGTNYIRVRVWNDPRDEQGNGYGGGNNDLETAKVIGQYASKAGMKVLVDFHYSDFWADPKKQKAPKAWTQMSADEKAQAIRTYTKDSVKYLLDNGVNVGMVQIGNETTDNICGISFSKDIANACKLFAAGCDAVHELAKEYNTEILAAIHFTNPERSGNYAVFAKRLADNKVDYDVFASSYYPYWHGTLANLTSELKGVADKYNKKVMVAETSWAWTLADGDGWDNTVRKNANDKNNSENYDFTVQGQCNEIRDVAQAVANVGEAGIGLFYWEAAWIPVQYAYNEDGTINPDILASNKELWEKEGSGWASSYASGYDPDDAGKWYGGSAVDNQAWFDFNGKELPTVNVYNYIRKGSSAPAIFQEIAVEDITVELKDAAAVKLPEKVVAKYSDGSTKEVAASWNNNELKAAFAAGVGAYTVTGTADVDGKAVDISLKLVINPDNCIINGDFENGLNNWEISNPILNDKDAVSNSNSGTGCLHFYTTREGDSATASQKLVLDKGYYNANAMLQGGGSGEADQYGIRVRVGDKVYSGTATLDGWKAWTSPSIENILIEEDGTEVIVELFISNVKAGAWGSFDDVKLYKAADYSEPGQPGEPDQPGQPSEPDQPDKSETSELKVNKITGLKKTYTLARSAKNFTLKASANGAKLSFVSSNSKVVKVDKTSGKVTVVGTGIAKITIRSSATKQYKAASLTININVKPDKLKVSKIAAGKHSATVKWKKLSGVSGYKLQISTDKKFGKKNTKTVYVSAKKLNTYLKSLKSNKRYYVRGCGYKNVKVSGKTTKLYGDWSKILSVKTKK